MIEYSKNAEIDLVDIYDYTKANLSLRQAIDSLKNIKNKLKHLDQNLLAESTTTTNGMSVKYIKY
jgi:plasmid stabilization system protein ParE